MDAETRQMDNGHFEMPLPFKNAMPVLPDNRDAVIKRLLLLDRKFKKHPNYKEQYVNFMKNLVEKGFAEKVPSNELDPTSKDSGHQWYILHFGVFHPKKPEKIRVVFDCSAKYYGTSLNDHLLQGPDLTNSLLGVLCRFQQERIAFICDVEQMFHQFVVANVHRNYLRFLWWEDGNTAKTPTEYRMMVHLFGARSSPSCCSYGLKRIADTFEEQCGTEGTNFVKHSFYVDDGLRSVPTVKAAKLLIQNTRRLCQYGGLNLHKFVSNSSEVLSDLPPESIAQGIANLPTKIHDATGASIEWALGVYWCIENDTLQFSIMLKDKPLTCRAILSTIGTVYDPLGIVAPVLLLGRQILQELCGLDADWDTPLPEYLHAKGCKWRADIPLLEQLTVQRCLKPDDDRKIKSIELHQSWATDNVPTHA